MSYDEADAQRDAAYDEMYEAISKEVRADTIKQFSSDRLKSYYVQNPHLMRPAWNRLIEGTRLVANEHFDAGTIFFASSMELFFASPFFGRSSMGWFTMSVSRMP